MLIDRPFTEDVSSKVLRPYLEYISGHNCPLCKDRQTGGKTIRDADTDVYICDVCSTKLRNSHYHHNFLLYLTDICSLATKVIDVSKIRPNEKILGTEIYTEEESQKPITITEKLCNQSEVGIYFCNFKNRWIVNELSEGYLITELNTDIGFIISSDKSPDTFTPDILRDHPNYVVLHPSPTFAEKVTHSILAANTI